MKDIYFQGLSHGLWDDETLPRLAEKLGVSVDDINAASDAHGAKMAIDSRAAKEVDTRLGTPRKINAVTANTALMGLDLAGAMLIAMINSDNIKDMRESVINQLGAMFPDDKNPHEIIMAMVGAHVSGDMKTPLQAYGLQKSVDKAAFCANEAHNIIIEIATNGAQQEAQQGDFDPEAA